MRLNHVTILTLAVFGVILSAFVGVISMERRAYQSHEAQISMEEALASVRLLQISTRALQSERASIRAIAREWEQARSDFDLALRDLNRDLQPLSADMPQLQRLSNTWGRMEKTYSQVRTSMASLERRGFLDRIANSSLMVKYQEMLIRPASSDTELAELGLLLFHLEHVDRLVIEVETELLSLGEDLQGGTEVKVQVFRYTAAAVLVLALLLVSGLLWRIARLYGSVKLDNAARRAAEQAARASEADLNITLNSIGEAVLAVDTEGRLVRMNPAAEELTLWNQTEALARPLAELFVLADAENREPIPNPVGAVLHAKAASQHHERVTLVRRDGSERMVATLATPIRDERHAGIVLVIRDVTEQQRLEEQLRRAQKIESLGQLAGGVAHDFNNILQVVKANLSFLDDVAYLPGEARQYLSQIGEASDRAADLTRQLLALGRRQTLQVRELDPAELIRAVLQLIRRVIGENIEIDFSTEESVDWVRVDAGQLEQVVINLCVNARDAMPRGGRLTLSLANLTAKTREAGFLPKTSLGRQVLLTVSDNGHGMLQDTLARIFEPFFTTKPMGKGTGLGLSVVYGIVQQHGGSISVESTINSGTTFRVYLPSFSRPAITPPSAAPKIDMRQGASRNELILLVEDDEAVRGVAQRILLQSGYRVICAGDGEEACLLASKHGREIALAILDVVMPRLGGIDAAMRIRDMFPGVPTILCTGYAGGISLPDLGPASNWRLLSKPYSKRELLEQVQGALQYPA